MKLSYNVHPTAPDDIVRQLPPLTVLSTPDSSTPHILGLTLSIKLQENNYLLSNQQVEGVILAQRAHKVVMNPRIPVKFKTPQDQLEGKISDVYEIWIIQDQVVFILLISMIYEYALPRVLSCKHVFEL